ncbi:MAG: hypothetical protein H7249_19950 [Chitinophagaceae bacterium]|nr:hypothetical protein [Oligoflexus sp.]
MDLKGQPWLKSVAYDSVWILSPPFFATVLVASIAKLKPELLNTPLSPLAWLLFILAIDVGHVYASLYRTVLSARMWRDEKRLLLLVPLVAYALVFAAYQWDALIFWRLLSYIAVFHFVRQPYGLFMLYKRNARRDPLWVHRLDQIAIYTASLYPLALWHLDPSRTFNWFVPGDFLIVKGASWRGAFHVTALIIACLWTSKEIFLVRTGQKFNVPKAAVLIGTALSFGMGILYWNSDFAFTATNVISHGVAYMGLIYLADASRTLPPFPKAQAFVKPALFVLSLLVFAYLEEALWDTMIWAEHPEFFSLISNVFGDVRASEGALAWLVPLLALPQLTHYIWDGFIWRKRPSAASISSPSSL